MSVLSRRVAGFVATSLIVLGATTRPAAADDLWEIYTQALANDATFQSAKFDYEATKLQAPIARTGFRPLITTGGGLGQQRSDVTGDYDTSENNQLNLNFDLPFYDRSLRREINQAELVVDSASLQLENARHNLILRVAEAYFTLLAAIDAKEVARLQKVTIKRQLDLATERLDVGLGTQTDVFEAQSRFAQADADVINAQVLIDNSIQNLRTIIGEVPPTIAPIREDAPLDPPSPNELNYWVDRAMGNNLLLRIEDYNVDIALEEIERQRAARSPIFGINANQRWQDTGNDTNTTSVAVTLDWPLYLGGSIRLRTEQAGFQYNSAEQARIGLEGQVQAQTTSSFLAVNSGISQVNALAEAIRAGASALEANEEGFSAGLTTNIVVLDAQRDLSRSQTDYLSARYNYILDILRLERAVGDLDEADLQLINRWLHDGAAEISLSLP